MDYKKVAVIMSVYRKDRIDYFKDAVNSILNQDYICQLFLFRDGVVPTVLQAYIDFLSKNGRINIYQSENNLGLARALNYLIDKVLEGNYDYIARMDSDDISINYRIRKQISFLEENLHIGVCGTSCKEFGSTYSLSEKHLPSSHDELIDFSLVRCPFIHPTVVFRAGIFKMGIRYPTNTHLTEDMALWFKLLHKGIKFSNLNEILLKYRLSDSAINRRKGVGKAFHEFNLRARNMFLLGRVTVRNSILITARLVFHLLPIPVMKFIYKYLELEL